MPDPTIEEQRAALVAQIAALDGTAEPVWVCPVCKQQASQPANSDGSAPNCLNARCPCCPQGGPEWYPGNPSCPRCGGATLHLTNPPKALAGA